MMSQFFASKQRTFRKPKQSNLYFGNVCHNFGQLISDYINLERSDSGLELTDNIKRRGKLLRSKILMSKPFLAMGC